MAEETEVPGDKTTRATFHRLLSHGARAFDLRTARCRGLPTTPLNKADLTGPIITLTSHLGEHRLRVG